MDDNTRVKNDLRALTAYIQAVHDLSVTPLFAESHPQPTVNFLHTVTEQLGHIEFRVADPYVLRAALVPFRTIWLESEPCNYAKISKILGKYSQGASWYVTFLKQQYTAVCQSTFPWRIAARQAEHLEEAELLPSKDIINLWLNSRLFHIGKEQKDRSTLRWRFNREDFRRARERIGHARFEYLFNMAVYCVAMQATNMYELAEFTARRLVDNGTHDNIVDSISRPGKQPFSDGTSIVRSSPGITPQPTTFGEKLALLRRESRFNSLDRAFDMLYSDNEQLAGQMLVNDNFESLLKALGFTLATTMPSVGHDGVREEDTCLQDDPNVTIGMSSCLIRGNEFWTSNLHALNSELLLARNELLTRQDWMPKAQPIWKRALTSCGIHVPFPYPSVANKSSISL